MGTIIDIFKLLILLAIPTVVVAALWLFLCPVAFWQRLVMIIFSVLVVVVVISIEFEMGDV